MNLKEGKRLGLISTVRALLSREPGLPPEQETALEAEFQRQIEHQVLAGLFGVYTNSVATQEETVSGLQRDTEAATPLAREIGLGMIDDFRVSNERMISAVERGLLRSTAPERRTELQSLALNAAISHWSDQLERRGGDPAIITSAIQRLEQRRQALAEQPAQAPQNS